MSRDCCVALLGGATYLTAVCSFLIILIVALKGIFDWTNNFECLLSHLYDVKCWSAVFDFGISLSYSLSNCLKRIYRKY